MQPGTAFLQDNKLRARPQRLTQLQRIAVIVACAHRCFLDRADASAPGIGRAGVYGHAGDVGFAPVRVKAELRYQSALTPRKVSPAASS